MEVWELINKWTERKQRYFRRERFANYKPAYDLAKLDELIVNAPDWETTKFWMQARYKKVHGRKPFAEIERP
jgi:aminoglycoside phosphotransferase (APT) family kinase protein